MPVQTPDWAKDAVFYQIFPDRFARSPRTEHPDHLDFKPWGTPPEEQGFQGGDLRGIVDRLDYLENLGVTALYLNPIFASAANHRYHTYDYLEVDPILGGDAALRELLDAAHEREMRVVLDGVFNHASRGFWPFHHVLENGPDSPYVDWFHVRDWPLRPYAGEGVDHNYAAWAGLPALPKLNTDNPDVQDYLLEVARHWIDVGIDGWRLDVPEEIETPGFWRRFRTVVKDANPDAYLVGEIWGEAPDWLEGDRFDATMNYPFTGPTLSFFGADTLRTGYKKPHLTFEPLGAPAFAERIEAVFALYDPAVTRAQLNLLDSHDMGRARWIMGGDVAALKLAALFQMTVPGAPCIYYGDEIGMTSAGDPHCRAAFPWDRRDDWNEGLLQFYQDATALRHDHAVLRRGTFEVCYAEGQTVAFRRAAETPAASAAYGPGAATEALVAFNAGTTPDTFSVDADRLAHKRLRPVWPPDAGEDAPLAISDDGTMRAELPPRSGAVWVPGGP